MQPTQIEEKSVHKKSVHFIGIGGIGMSGLANLLLENGVKVTGSDLKESALLESLKRKGASIYLSHSGSNIHTQDYIVISSDIGHENPEIRRAKELQIPIIHRSDLLKELAEKGNLIAIAGTHGKTTTSSLLAHTLCSAGLDPSFAVGGILKNTGMNARFGRGDHFVIEADESDGTFLKYGYQYAIVTNVDTDHIVHYGSYSKVQEAFKTFIDKSSSPEHMFLCGEDAFLRQFSSQGILYGFHEGCSLRACNIRYERHGTLLDITFNGRFYKDVISPLYGRHNVLNALSVFGLCIELGASEDQIRKGFISFQGVERRLELLGAERDILIYDDYGHHPTEVRATLQSLRQKVGGRKITAVFQPHRYSRMKYLLDEFSEAFIDADCVVVTDIYSAGEKPVDGVSSEVIFQKIAESVQGECLFATRSELVTFLQSRLRPHEAIIFFGAGDTVKLAHELSQSVQSIPKLQVGLIFGGENSEHKISKISAHAVNQHLNKDLYNIKLFEISSKGSWNEVDSFSKESNHVKSKKRLSQEVVASLEACDVVIPILHGPKGEDGTVQGFFELLGKPYVGCGVVGSSCSMDKVKTKRIAQSAGVPIVPFYEVKSEDWHRRRQHVLEQIISILSFPLIIKPAHLGSAVGVVKVDNEMDLEAGLDLACSIDRLVLVEKCVKIRHEIECAVLGNEDPEVSSPGEVCTGGKVYDYAAKYASSGFATTLNPQISDRLKESIQKHAINTYRTLDCHGMARVDFFVDDVGDIFLNEVNPIPGFTAISLYPSLWMREGKSFTQLISDLVLLAFEQFMNDARCFNRQLALGRELEKSCAV